MVYVAGFGHSHHRMDEQASTHLGSCPLGQFLVDPMQRVASLESNNVFVPHSFQDAAHLRRCAAQVREIIVLWQVDDFQRAADANFAPACHLRNHRVLRIR